MKLLPNDQEALAVVLQQLRRRHLFHRPVFLPRLRKGVSGTPKRYAGSFKAMRFWQTHGITEAINNDGELFSDKRLTEYLRETRELELDVSLDKLIDMLRDYTGQEHFDDDVSIVGLAWEK